MVAERTVQGVARLEEVRLVEENQAEAVKLDF